MTKEEIIVKGLEKFSFLRDKIRIARERRIFVTLSYDKFFCVFEYAAKEQGFLILSAITGLDEGDALGFIYHLSREDGIVLSIKTSVPKESPIRTITDYFADAEIYERELVDLFGAKVEGLREGRRYPLPDKWPKGQYPLRKDWKPSKSVEKKESGKDA